MRRVLVSRPIRRRSSNVGRHFFGANELASASAPSAGWIPSQIGMLATMVATYTMTRVTPAERSTAAGLTGNARTVGAAVSPLMAGPLFATAALAALPFFTSGGLRIRNDLLQAEHLECVAFLQEPAGRKALPMVGDQFERLR